MIICLSDQSTYLIPLICTFILCRYYVDETVTAPTGAHPSRAGGRWSADGTHWPVSQEADAYAEIDARMDTHNNAFYDERTQVRTVVCSVSASQAVYQPASRSVTQCCLCTALDWDHTDHDAGRPRSCECALRWQDRSDADHLSVLLLKRTNIIME